MITNYYNTQNPMVSIYMSKFMMNFNHSTLINLTQAHFSEPSSSMNYYEGYYIYVETIHC